MEVYTDVIHPIMNFLSGLLVFALGAIIFVAVCFFVVDISQNKDAVR